MDDILKIREEHKKEEKARRETRKATVKKMAGYLSTSTKKASKLIGIKGAIGGLAGLAVAGPIGGLVGIVAGKNAVTIGKKGYKLASDIYDFNERAKKYEEINPDAKYTAQIREQEDQLEEVEIEAEAMPIALEPNKFKRYLTYAQDGFEGVGEGLSHLCYKTKDRLNKLENIYENAREYSKLENEAKELSTKTSSKISPKELYAFKKEQKGKERKTESYKALTKKILLAIVQMKEYEDKRTEENINTYNSLIKQHRDTALELGITDPRQYFKLIRYRPVNS